MAGKHRPPRPCWRVRVHRAIAHGGTIGQHMALIIGLHAASYTVFESSIKHGISTFIHIGH